MGSAEQQCARTDARNRVSLMGRGGFEAPKSYRVHVSFPIPPLAAALARKSVAHSEKVSSKPACGFDIKDKHTLASGVLCGNVAPALWPAWGV